MWARPGSIISGHYKSPGRIEIFPFLGHSGRHRQCLLGLQQATPALSLLAFVQGQTQDSDTLAETARLLPLAHSATLATAAQDEAQGAAWTIEQAVAAALQSEDQTGFNWRSRAEPFIKAVTVPK